MNTLAEYDEKRERIYVVKACARYIVHCCAARMDSVDRSSEEYKKIRLIQQKFGNYIYDSLEQTPADELEKLLIDTPSLVRRILDPSDKLDGIL